MQQKDLWSQFPFLLACFVLLLYHICSDLRLPLGVSEILRLNFPLSVFVKKKRDGGGALFNHTCFPGAQSSGEVQFCQLHLGFFCHAFFPFPLWEEILEILLDFFPYCTNLPVKTVTVLEQEESVHPAPSSQISRTVAGERWLFYHKWCHPTY